MPPPLQFHPPLVNSACPWATDLACLKALLESPSTGAVTTRTSLLPGFDHQPERHRFTFFNPGASNTPDGDTYSFPDEPGRASTAGPSEAAHTASLNTLGYSPIPLQGYLDMIRRLASELPPLAPRKTFIVSVTGSPDDIAACYAAVAALAPQVPFPLALEVNLSCPNIPGRPPPAYDPASLRLYLAALPSSPAIPLGVKTPPYTHAGQYQSLLGTLREERAGAKLSFITATNTLGSCLVMTTSMGGHHGGVTTTTTTGPALPLGDSGGIGGMAGPPLHPLALGNVATIRRMLDEGDGSLRHIAIVGVGGVSDGGGYRRMRAVGASMVGVGTGLGSEGVDVFAKIERDIGSKW